MRNPLLQRRQRHKARPREVVFGGLISRQAMHTAVPGLDLPERIWEMGSTNYAVGQHGLMVGGEGKGGGKRLPNPDPDDDRELAYGSGMGGGIFAVPLVHRGRIRIYPLVGAGGGGSGAVYIQRVMPGHRRGEKSPKLELIDGIGGVHLRVGLGMEFRLGGRAGVFIGLRFGYVFVPIQFGEGRPSMGGPFSQFVFGVYYPP